MGDVKLKKWKCHKTVHAGKIVGLKYDGLFVNLELDDGQIVAVDTEWANKHDVEDNGYYVVYEDGYASWSPAEPFEEGYTLIKE